MSDRQGIASLVVGTALVAVLLAGFAIAIAASQTQSRRSLEHQARERTRLVAGLLDAIFGQAAHLTAAERRTLSAPTVPARALQALRGQNDYLALLGSSGRVLAHSSGFGAQARAAVRADPALSLLRRGDAWALGDRFPYGRRGVIDFGVRLRSAHELRYLVVGAPADRFGALVRAELTQVHGVEQQHQTMLDGHGVVIGSTVRDRPPGYIFHTAGQRRVLRAASGIAHTGSNGPRYFDAVPLPNSTWRLVISIPVAEFYSSVEGLRQWLPWVILAAFGGVALVALWLVWRAMQSSRRIRVTNARLSLTNAELEAARRRLEQVNDALARSNTALERQAQELVRSNTELDQFAQVASHDLQEPLRKVRTFTERVTETEAQNLSPRGADYLRRANGAAERMQTLIEDLLRFSRVSTQSRPFAPVDLGAVIAEVLDDLSELVQQSEARVDVGPLPTINADPTQMRQLLQNLISNALKFRREDVAPVVRVEASWEPGWLTLTVADNGIGFEPQYRTRIFRVFERLHGRGAYPGTGIGLALCRKIAERHGGTVVADGVLGEGATFTVTLQTERAGAVSDLPEPSAPEGEREPYVAV
ncbi:MAG TPA: ATP-binding protein [Solirubrobacteraceae bacterium]|nr:ATP-binding protein [Solirubrobacteraceae bacterium]